MTHLTLYICAAIGLLLGLVLWIVFSARLRLTTAEDALEWAQTDDGWALSLHRYLPPGVARAYPVILCHGLGANRFNLDFDAEYSLARFLRARGFEVFVLELRGCGRSHWTGGGRPPAWNFDDFVHHDLPAAIARVRELSGAAQVDWVGHSQGGMVMYAALSGAVGPAVHAFVAIGSPAAFGDHHWLKPLARFHSMARLAPASATPRLVRLVAPLSGHFVVPGLAMLALVDRSGGEGAQIQVTTGDQVPGYGRVTAIQQRGASWIVQTDKGPDKGVIQ